MNIIKKMFGTHLPDSGDGLPKRQGGRKAAGPVADRTCEIGIKE